MINIGFIVSSHQGNLQYGDKHVKRCYCFLSAVVAAAAACAVTAAAVPTSGTETFTILITDIEDGDHGSAKLTLGAP